MPHSSSVVHLTEVGPRDGLQSIKTVMPTADKIAWINALHSAGLREIEVGSYVPPKLLPQMADVSDVVRHALTLPDLMVSVVVPNLRGAQAAFADGVHKVTIPVSVSEAHSLSNVRKTHAQMLDEVASIVEFRNTHLSHTRIDAALSTAFGCTIQGEVAEDEVIRMAVALAERGVEEIGLSDTTGYANPAQVKRLFTRLFAEIGTRVGDGHFHNTRGLGLANVLAAFECGVTAFDSSLAGLGGCPFAPGASGNVVTEDMVFMFEAMGVDTGVDLNRLIAVRELVHNALPNEPLHGMLANAGVPKGWY